jgi:acetylserotonin N-methyltransferase
MSEAATSLPDPAPIVDSIEAFRRSKAMFAAVSLGVFDRLAEAPADAATLAAQIGANPDAFERLLDACAGLGLLDKKHRTYSCTPVAWTYLRRSSPHTMTGYILYSNRLLYALWGNLEDAVREGTPRWAQTFHHEGPIFAHFFKNEESKQEFLAGMHGFGLISSPRVVAIFDLSRFRRLVDLGGATGHLAKAACERYPAMRAAVLDLAPVIDVARQYLSGSGVSERIELLPGDFFFCDPLPEADLFSLGRVLHDWSETRIRGCSAGSSIGSHAAAHCWWRNVCSTRRRPGQPPP